MKKEEFIILTLCMMILFLTGILETMYVTVLPHIIWEKNSKVNHFNTKFSTNNKQTIYNVNSSMKAYIEKMVSFITSVKYITRFAFGPIPGILIDKKGCLNIIILGLTLEFVSIFLSFVSYDEIAIHAVMRMFDAGALVCMNTSCFALIWIVFHAKGEHPVYLGILNMLYTFGTFVGPYIATFFNSYLGFISLPIFTSVIFSFCTIVWSYIFISSMRNQKYIDILHNTTAASRECTLEEKDIDNLRLQNPMSGDNIEIESNSNNENKIIIKYEKHDEQIVIVESQQNNELQIIPDDNENCGINKNTNNERAYLSSFRKLDECVKFDLSGDHSSDKQVSYKTPEDKHEITCITSFFMFIRLMFNPYVSVCFLGIFISEMSMTLFSSTLTMWMIHKYNVSQRKVGSVWLPGSIISLIMPIVLIVVFKRWSKFRYLGTLFSAFIHGLACLALPFYPQYWYVAFTILTSVINILMNEYVYFPMIFDIITDNYDVHLSGRSSIITNMAVSWGMLFGSLIGAPLVNMLGFQCFYTTIGTIYIFVSFFNIFTKVYSN